MQRRYSLCWHRRGVTVALREECHDIGCLSLLVGIPISTPIRNFRLSRLLALPTWYSSVVSLLKIALKTLDMQPGHFSCWQRRTRPYHLVKAKILVPASALRPTTYGRLCVGPGPEWDVVICLDISFRRATRFVLCPFQEVRGGRPLGADVNRNESPKGFRPRRQGPMSRNGQYVLCVLS